MKQPGADDFEFVNIESFEGYNSAIDKTNLKPPFMIRGSKNVYKKLSGTIAARTGLKLRGAIDSTSEGVDSSFEWYTALGAVLPLRICDGKLQIESSILDGVNPVWYTLLSSLTKTRWVFDSWWDNTAKKDVLLMVDGTSTLRNWSGATALFVSYLATVITLDRNATTAGFSSTGTITIDGTTYTYTGISGSTLTGTSDASAVVANAVVFEAVNSNSNQPASTFLADFIKVIDNHVWVGSYSSRLIYISKTTSYTDYTQSTPRIPGDGELITLDQTANGITVHSSTPLVSAGSNLWYEVTFNQITVGTTLSEQTKVNPIRSGGLQGALAHEFMDTSGNDVVFLDKGNQLRMYGSFVNLFEAKFPLLSLPIYDELKDEDFTGGHVRVVDKIVYITAPLSGRDYMYEIREFVDSNGGIHAERIWQPPQVRNISRIAVIDGVTYGHSNSNPQIYQLWDTMQWHDDSPSGDPLPYDSIMRMSYQQGERKQGKIKFDKLYVEGYITQGTKLYANVYWDYQGATGIANLDLNSTGDIKTYSGGSAPSIGDSSLGDNPLGDGLTIEANDQEMLPKFRIIKGVASTDCFEYALELYTSDVDSRWEVLVLGVNLGLADSQGIEIVR